MPDTLPAVSVSIITYNQRELIGRAIDSVLMQEVNFPYEIIIGDDCSNDGTQEVIREYQRRYPDKIQMILHPRRYNDNILGRTNNTTNLLNCRGKYTAMLDGDDYWTDPHKLQRQYDRLEAQPELSLCLHDARMDYEVPAAPHEKRIKLVSHYIGKVPTGIYTHEDIAMRNRLSPFIGSIMFRTAYLRELPDWFYKVVAADYALLLILSKQGLVYYDATPGAAYYIMRRSFQRTMRKQPNVIYQELRDVVTYVQRFPATRNNGKLTKGRARLHWHLHQHYRKKRKIVSAIRHLGYAFARDPIFSVRMVVNLVCKGFVHAFYLLRSRASRSAEKSATIRS